MDEDAVDEEGNVTLEKSSIFSDFVDYQKGEASPEITSTSAY